MPTNCLLYLCVILWGISTFLNRLAVEHLSPYLMQVIVGLVFIVYTPFALRMAGVGNPFVFRWNYISIALTMTAALISLCANVILYSSLKGNQHTGSSTMLIALYPVITLLLSAIFLQEHFTITKIMGVGAMILGAVLLSN